MESQLMALPLALAMSVNVAFVAGAVFVPGLWGVREMLFPLALGGLCRDRRPRLQDLSPPSFPVSSSRRL